MTRRATMCSFRRLRASMLALSLSSALAIAAEVTYALTVANGRVPDNMRLIRVKQNDVVKLEWRTDKPLTVHLHGYGQRYDLPIPLSFYLVGAAAAVVVSFLIVGLFVREAPRVHSYPRIDLIAAPLGRWLASPSLALGLKSLALAGFIITILAGFRGDQNPYRNIAP